MRSVFILKHKRTLYVIQFCQSHLYSNVSVFFKERLFQREENKIENGVYSRHIIALVYSSQQML